MFINCNFYKLFNSNYIYERPQNSAQRTKIDKGQVEVERHTEVVAGVGDETFTKCAKQIRQEARCAAAYVRDTRRARVASVVE